MNGLLYSALALQTTGVRYPLEQIFKTTRIDSNNHLYPYDPEKPKSFDYMQGGIDAEFSTKYVSTRGLRLTSARIGEKSEGDDATLDSVVRNLLAINSESTEEEQRLNSYLQLAYQKVYSRITSRSFLNIDMVSSQPKFLLMTKDIPVYFLVITNDNATYLLWSNEESLEQRVRKQYGEKFYFYRLPTYKNGICVIQSRFLEKRFRHWQRTMRDSLKVMNALESHLDRRWITVDSDRKMPPVNDNTRSDQPGVPHQPLGS